MDPDRLKEEKERGMTTDLGFVFLGDNVTIIDVPGHERFVHNMLAGASTLDLVILVIAADDGVMPQTIEHFEITRLLGITRGIIALTKIDLVDTELVELVKDDIKKFVAGTYLENGPIIPLSSITGEGIDQFLDALKRLIDEVKERRDRGIFRLWIDRCFTMKGFGLVVAGTVLSGRARVGERLEILPICKEVRVRGLQVHTRSVDEVVTGERAAFNLIGVERSEVERGYALVQPGYFKPTRLISARLQVLKSTSKPLRNRLNLLFHIGSVEAMARLRTLEANEIKPGGTGIVQLELDREVVADWNDRFVLRTVAPLATVAGGVVIESNPTLAKRKNGEVIKRLSYLEQGALDRQIENELLKLRFELVKVGDLAKAIRVKEDLIAGELKKMFAEHRVVNVGKSYIHATHLNSLSSMIVDRLERFHKKNPSRKGIRVRDLKSKFSDVDIQLFNFTIDHLNQNDQIEIADDFIRTKSFTSEIKEEDLLMTEEIEKAYRSNLFQPEKIEDLTNRYGESIKKAVKLLIDGNRLISLGEYIFHYDAVEEAKQVVQMIGKEKGEIRVSDFRKAIGTSRKYALPLLQHLDRLGITVKVGEVRKLRRSQTGDQ